MPIQYSADRSVLLKILLHAAAHPAQSVNGVLLGEHWKSCLPRTPHGVLKDPKAWHTWILTIQMAAGKVVGSQGGKGAAAEEPASPRKPAVQILDALPLFHSALALASPTEVGLVQASHLCNGKEIVQTSLGPAMWCFFAHEICEYLDEAACMH